MEASFWHDKWQRGDIAFHEGEANPFLVKHVDQLHLPPAACVFLPLCGKTRDIAWLLARGYQVAGAELSEIAITALFAELGVQPDIATVGKLTRFSARGIDIYAGDIFDVRADYLGPIDAIYDRAALVALPEHLRQRYTAHLMAITNTAPQLLVCYQYDPLLMDGPPFSISDSEVGRHYAARYELTAVEHRHVEGGLKGKVAAAETAWLLERK